MDGTDFAQLRVPRNFSDGDLWRQNLIYDLSFEVIDFLNERSSGNFFRYEGSLTTPPCDEIVQWNVFETPIEVSPETAILFEVLKGPEMADSKCNVKK